jgi:potassium efflux system protein
LALVIGLASALLAKNLPTLVEVGFLERSGMDTGSRYAVTTLVAYSVAAAGAIWGFSLLGIHWSQIQWLIAALGVGIGFGLQEIVANFISGLIILFERPIRIGDVVTIGDTDGIVTRIRIRATTIQNWDKKELLVPNKEFITGRLLNWSLSDEINRITIRVGISYACDVERALKILEETARDQEHILDDPPPRVIFENFGASSLDLVLHCYLSSLEHRLATITDLHRLILRRFKKAGLSIPFQQHDVHLDSDKPLVVRVVESQPQE